MDNPHEEDNMLLILAAVLLIIAIAGGVIIHPLLFALAIVAISSSSLIDAAARFADDAAPRSAPLQAEASVARLAQRCDETMVAHSSGGEPCKIHVRSARRLMLPCRVSAPIALVTAGR